jgi:phage/plasmid-like protein (TIGR03299 family)
MAHEVESMFYAGEVPWHGLGKGVESEKTAQEAIVLAGMDWTSHLEPIYLAGKKHVDNIPIIGEKIEDKQAVVRDTDNAILGVVGPNYNIIQNQNCFDFLDDIIGAGQAVFHTAGALHGGKRIFITIKLTEEMKIGQDEISKYLLLAAGHDGTMAVHVKFTPIRVVCNNTLSLALHANVTPGKTRLIQDTFRIKHTQNYTTRVEECRKALKLSDFYYTHMEQEFNKMLDQTFSESQFSKFAEKLLPDKPNKDGEVKPSVRRQKTRDNLLKIFTEDPTTAHCRKTRWAAFNAVTTYVDHNRPTRVEEGKNPNDLHFDTVLYKSGRKIRETAYQLLTSK